MDDHEQRFKVSADAVVELGGAAGRLDLAADGVTELSGGAMLHFLRPADLYVPPDQRQLQASVPSWFIPPPFGWRHPVVGRYGWLSDPELLAFGQYVKRGRYLAKRTQQRLADESGVDQGQISRLERALAPAMRVDRLVKLGGALGRSFPLGFCPHEHWCPWQPAPPPPPDPPIDGLTPALREIFNRQPGSEEDEAA